MDLRYKHAVVIGRFQPLHYEHMNLIRHAASIAENIIVLVGSAGEARSPNNPFTYDERANLLAEFLCEEGIANRTSIHPNSDYRYDNHVWALHTKAAIKKITENSTDIVLVGHKKDDSSFYLDMFPEWSYEEYTGAVECSATDIRKLWYELGYTTDEFNALPTPLFLRKFLVGEHLEPYYNDLYQDYTSAKEYRDSWKVAPFPPVFTATDAIIRKDNKLLLIRRKGPHGAGLLAMPGGFLEPNLTLLDNTYKEIEEETGVSRKALMVRRPPVVFDHPARSQRGRMLTHVHEFTVIGEINPVAGDDAGDVEWVAIKDLEGLRDQFFSDHWHILYNVTGGFTS